MPISPSSEKHRSSRPDLTLSFYTRCLIILLKSPDPLLGKGCIKKEQPPFGSCSLIPKGFHSIYFIPYI